MIQRSTGTQQCSAVIDTLNSWKCFTLLIGMVFDTTSSNTGKHAGCCISIELALGRSIMWLACRHHVYEIHVKHVAYHINSARTSPSDALCVRFQKEFSSFDQSTEVAN